MEIVIAGGGLAAQRCAETLRSRGHDGAIRMVCAEDVRPYDRPPLSKEALAGDPSLDDVALRPHGWYAENGVELIHGTAAGLEPLARELRLEGGTTLRYDALLVATGSDPRALPLLERYSNVSMLRTLGDAAALRAALRPGARLAVIGAGFVGQEVAATARSLGVEVTMIDAAPAPLAPVLGAELGEWFADLHRDEGVEVVLDTMLAAARGNGRVEQLELTDGRRIECDHALVGVGVAPATRWLAGSGLDTDGVRIDDAGRTAVPGVFAAGDAARPFDRAIGMHVRTEHWEAAGRQGQAAARAMLGLDVPAPGPGSFWSDQYGLRIQYVGHAPHADEVTLDGDPRARDFTALFRRGGHVVAGLLVGRPRALPELRRTVQAGLGSLQPA